jgi:hypothetical protein
MTSSARIMLSLIAGAAGSFAVVLAGQAMAQDGPAKARQESYWTRPWVAIDHCAAYGPEFTSVEGTQTCVKIGGHVRVEFDSRSLGQTTEPAWGQGGTAPAAMRTNGSVGGDALDFPTAQHLRVRQDAAPAAGGW